MKKQKIHVDVGDLNYLYWAMWVFYVAFGTLGMGWFGDYYFDGAGKSDAAIFSLSAGALLLGGADQWVPVSARKWVRWSAFAINVVFLVVIFVLFGPTEIVCLYLILLLILAAKCSFR